MGEEPKPKPLQTYVYRPKDPNVKSVSIQGMVIHQNPPHRAIGQAHPILQNWVGRTLRLTILKPGETLGDKEKPAGVGPEVPSGSGEGSALPPTPEPEIEPVETEVLEPKAGPPIEGPPEMVPASESEPEPEEPVSEPTEPPEGSTEDLLLSEEEAQTMEFDELREYANRFEVTGRKRGAIIERLKEIGKLS